MKKGKVAFMGTPDFAVPCLAAVIADGYEVCGVFTQPDKPKGRGYKLAPPPVKELALSHKIPVFQPVTLKTGEAEKTLRDLAPDVIVVVAYGKILPRSVLAIPPLGCVNIHASLLPKYRGAAPIQWAVLNGDRVTGITSMYMAEGLDTGDVILQEELAIGSGETAGELHDRMSLLGGQVLSRTLKEIFAHTAPRRPQPAEGGFYAAMLDKEMAKIDWGKKGEEIFNLVRGLNPWPVAYFLLEGKKHKVFAARPHPGRGKAPYGEVTAADPARGFFVSCGDGEIEILRLQAEGGRRMTAQEYLMGHAVPRGTLLL